MRQRDVPRGADGRPSAQGRTSWSGGSATGLARRATEGFFEVDVLVDLDTDEVYLGELNPRISGASSITNVTAGAYADMPLFLFHLLEYMGVDFELDVDEINARWEELASADLWTQMVIKETSPIVELITAAAADRPVLRRRSGALVFRRAALDWHQLQNESEASSCESTGPATTAGRAQT